jgi:hypothetical protein
MLQTDTHPQDALPATNVNVGIKENRRLQRIALPLPVRVEVKIDNNAEWNEVTRLSDVSAFGAGFFLKRPLKRGRLAYLTIPMPRQLRSFDYGEPNYKIWGVVRRCLSVGEDPDKPEYAIGVAFTGKNPPNSYLENPAQLYDLVDRGEGKTDGLWKLEPANLLADESHLPKSDRRHTRYSIPETLIIQKVDEQGDTIDAQVTVSENISLGGAAVLTSMKAERGTFLRVTCERLDVTILSVVRGYRVGNDGISRLHLEFIDKHFPIEGVD